jgi:hypothetical protein
MFEHLWNDGKTAIFRRTGAPLFDPHADGWWLQSYNKKRFPIGFSRRMRKTIVSSVRALGLETAIRKARKR